ncbi:MAG: acetyl-CoA C-acyltransferase [Saprospiraceae bacterium]
MAKSFIFDGLRTPIGTFKGTLSDIRTDDIAALVIKSLMERYPEIDGNYIDDVILGCANQAGEDNRNVARMALLLAGLPVSVPGETVNRLCASGMSAVVHAHRAIQANDGNLFIAGGVEHMTRGPYAISKTSTAYGTDAKMYDTSFGWRFVNPKMKEMYGIEAMGETAENLQVDYDIPRGLQDEFAYNSQQKAAKANDKGRFAKEIIPVSISIGKQETLLFEKDEFIKPATTIEKLSTLKPAFKVGGTVTAGNASGLNDGAAAILIGNDEAAAKFGLKPLASVVSSAVVGVEPRTMGIGPVKASQLALKRAGLTLQDMDLIEINEAFAVQVLACLKAIEISPTDPRINVNGGAIALGHPLGMSGARLLLTAAIELQERQATYALVTMCIGVGQGYAVVIKRE